MNDPISLEKYFSENIYLTPSEAHRELIRRRKDSILLREVVTFLKNGIPEVLQDFPKAILARTLTTPNHEFFEFHRLAQEAGLEGWCLEYSQDKFRAENFDKYYLGKLYFNGGVGKKGGQRLSTLRVVDFDNAEGKSIDSIETLWGESLVGFHHRLVEQVAPHEARFSDASQWVLQNGKKSDSFYPYYLALFLCHGVLFENFLLEDKPLIEKMFLPAIHILREKFNLFPLIVPLSPLEREYDLYWRQYPSFVKEVVLKK